MPDIQHTEPARKARKDSLEIQAPIKSVLVMEDRAQVSRQANVTLRAGRNTIIAGPVTPLIADRSLRCQVRPSGLISGRPDEEPRIVDLQVHRQYLIRQARPGKEREINEVIDKMVDEYQEVHDSCRAHFHEKKLLDRAAGGLAQQIRERLAVAPFDQRWPEEIEQLFRRLKEVDDQLLDAQWGQDDRRLKIEKLLDELRVVLKPVSEYRASLISEIVVPSNEVFQLEWIYQVPCTLWRPSYTAELLEGEQKVRWFSNGMVWQNTGEDWEQVALTFSTDRPTLGAELPLLADDILATRNKTEQENRVIEVTSRDQKIAKTGTVPEPEKSDTPPGLDDGGEVRTYAVPELVDVPSDGQPHQFQFDHWEEMARLEHLCLPDKAEFVFLRSLQLHPMASPLLAGPVSLVKNGGYVGQSRIPFVAGGERFELSWGSMDELVVYREVERDFKETKIRKRKQYTYKVAIFLANHSGENRKLRLVERLPKSELEQVEVKLLEKETTASHTRDEQGLVSWNIDLAAGEDRRIELAFSVILPQNVIWDA